MRKAVSGIMLTLLFTGMLTLAFHVQKAKASGTIYIRADGSIDPPDAPVITLDNVTYTLTDNITSDGDGIVVERSNITIDGAGYMLRGFGSGYGFNLSGINKVTIKNTNIRGFERGIFIGYSSSFNAVFGNNITDNSDIGIQIFAESFYNIIYRNNIIDNNEGVAIHNIGYSNNTVWGNNITNNEVFGIEVEGYYNEIFRNNITNNRHGIFINAEASGNTIAGNVISSSSSDGIQLSDAGGGNTFFGNTLTNNYAGIIPYKSSNNMIYHNNFVNNIYQVWDPWMMYPQIPPSYNIWDDGYPSSGNYWSNYTGVDVKSGPNQDQLGSDGIGDTPHVLYSDNQDRYPLMNQWSPLPVHNINTGLGFATIQEAINANETLDGHTIFVEAGTYYENVVVNKTVLLLGESVGITIIDANGTGNVVDVKADGVVIEGFIIQNSGYDASGIHIGDHAHVTIRNNTIINNDLAGIDVWDSWYNSISENNITNNYYGIVLQYSSENTLRDNHMSDNKRNFFIWGDIPNYFYHDIDSSNTVDDKPMCYWLDQHNRSVPSDAGYVALIYSSNITVQNLDLNNNGQGVLLVQTENSIIRGNNITNNRCSVYLLFSSNNTVSENSIVNSGSGIYLSDSSNNTIYGNNVANNYFGVDLSYRYVPSTNNTIYHNNFVNNTEQVYISTHPSYANFWDNGVEGNYWSNYTGVDANEDAIGDTPYIIDANNTDRYPLIAPITVFDAGTWNGTAYNVDVVTNSTVSNFKLNTTEKTISFNVTGLEFTAGFCRVTIPNIIVQDLWQGNYTVLLNGEPLPFRNWTDPIYTYIYINYTHTEHEIIIIPEFPSTMILLVLMLTTLIAITLLKKKRRTKPQLP